jgi:hypothetical protein
MKLLVSGAAGLLGRDVMLAAGNAGNAAAAAARVGASVVYDRQSCGGKRP